MMKCAICFRPMCEEGDIQADPEQLSCGHFYCQQCLALDGNECDADQKVSNGHATNLHNNFGSMSLSESSLSGPFRFWCRDCRLEATVLCEADAHDVCSLAEAREERLDALAQGEVALDAMQAVLEELVPALGPMLTDCSDGLQRAMDSVAGTRERLLAGPDLDTTTWGKAMDAARPRGLPQRASQLVSTLADPSSTCVLVVRPGTGVEEGLAPWRGSVKLQDDPMAKLLLCRLLFIGRLHREDQAAAEASVRETKTDSVAAPKWEERSNDLPPKKTKLKIGDRVVRGADWPPQCAHDGTPPGPGTVTDATPGTVIVKWDQGIMSRHNVGKNDKYEVMVKPVRLGPKVFLGLGRGLHVLDMERLHPHADLKAMTDLVDSGKLQRVRYLFNLNCQVAPSGSLKVLEKVSATAEILGLTGPDLHHMEVVRSMPRLQEVHVFLPYASRSQLQHVLDRMPRLRYLEVHCAFERPLPGLRMRSSGLEWLRCGIYPLATALALMAANADTLREVELVAASSLPYGCPDLAGALQSCGLNKLASLLLERNANANIQCRHEKDKCKTQKDSLVRTLACTVLCSKCDKVKK